MTGREIITPRYRERLNDLDEPRRSIAWKEFEAVLPNYGIDSNLLPIGYGEEGYSPVDESETSTVTMLPRGVYLTTLDRIAEVSVWAATDITPRFTTD
jgi:hypothetical protein